MMGACLVVVAAICLPLAEPLRLLPTRFDRASFESYWRRSPGALAARWGQFVQATAPLQLEAARLFAAGKLRRDDATFAASTRTALAKLGPTFIKLGQILSVREDVLGPVWSAELSKLQDGIEPASGDAAKEVIVRNFGSLDNFEYFDPAPVASASLAQVHRAVFHGNNVAVKVLRPGVVEQVAIDLCVLLRAAAVFETWAPRVLPSSNVDWRALLEGLAGSLWEEVDLNGEAERQRRFAKNMALVPRIRVPAVLESRREVMVSEWIEGTPLRAISSQPVLRAAVSLMRDAYCQAMFVDAYFHADCHGGNLLWMGDIDDGAESKRVLAAAEYGELCILDCGLMVDIDPSASDALLRLSLHLAARDWQQVVSDSVRLGFLPESLTPRQRSLAQGVASRIVGPYLDVGGGVAAASSYSASALLRDITAATTELPTSLPPQMVLLGRAVIQLEGLALRADSQYRLVDDILPVAARIALNQSSGGSTSLLYDLLYSAEEQSLSSSASSTPSLSGQRLRQLLSTAQGAGTEKVADGESLLDVLLEASAVRGLVAHEAANAIDALLRDVVWKTASNLPPSTQVPMLAERARKFVETIAPPLSPEEQLVLVRLPSALAQAVSSDATMGNKDEPLATLPTGLADLAAVRVTAEPTVRRALVIVLERALLQEDKAAREAIDQVAEELRLRLRSRLHSAGFPESLAELLAGGVRSPWEVLSRLSMAQESKQLYN